MTYRLLITGSRHGFPGLWQALDAIVARFGVPSEVHVREQTGVDQDARAWCRDRGYVLVPEAAGTSRPSPQRYHEGNARMVAKCAPGDIAVGFPDPGSRGTWACLRMALATGMKCYAADPVTRRVRRWLW